MRRRESLIRLGWLIAALGSGGLGAGCGCYDTSVSDLTIEPPTPCLDLSLPDTVSNCASGGSLEITGTNNCDATLVIPGSYRDYPHAGQDLTVPPGGSVSYDLGSAASPGTQDYNIVCELGDATVVLSFTGP
ncbi:MAG: hypothetical protein ABI333_20745 [bacterium]